MYSQRLNRLRQTFADQFIDSLLISDGDNLQYLTGFSGGTGDGYLVVTASDAILITDARYRTELAATCPELTTVITGNYFEGIRTVLADTTIAVLGFEDTLSLRHYQALSDLLSVDLVSCTDLVAQLRSVKTATEIEALRHATALMSDGMTALLAVLRPGITEKWVADWLSQWMREHGATRESFPTIVASGPRGAFPHGVASERVIQAHELVTIDCGFFVDGYTADLTRTVALGTPPATLEQAYQVVLAAQQAQISAVKAGSIPATIDQIGRQLMAKHGLSDAFIHGTGHGIGTSIHELPGIGRGLTTPLKAQQVITIEPGVYFPSLGGVRLEDDVLVTPSGCERLTTGSRQLIIV